MAAALVVASGLVEHTAGGLSTSSSACASRIKAAAAAAASNDAAAGPEKACLICMAGRETLSHGAKVSGNGNPMADAVLSCVEKLQDDRLRVRRKVAPTSLYGAWRRVRKSMLSCTPAATIVLCARCLREVITPRNRPEAGWVLANPSKSMQLIESGGQSS